MVVDRDGVFLCKLPLEMLLTKSSDLTVAEVMDAEAISVNALTSLTDVTTLSERRDQVYLPVVDDAQRLVGRIILDETVHLIRANNQ